MVLLGYVINWYKIFVFCVLLIIFIKCKNEYYIYRLRINKRYSFFCKYNIYILIN